MEKIRQDQEVLVIEKQTPDLVSRVQSLQITDERTSKFANDLMMAIKKAATKLEARRKFFVGPLNEHIKTINAEFKALTNPLTEALASIRNKMLGWQVKLRKQREEAESKKNSAVSDLLEEGVETKPEDIQKPSVHSSMGQSFLKKVWAFELGDFAKVPDEFKMLDEKKVNYTIKANIKTIKGVSECKLEIPGLKIYQKDQLGVR